MKETTKAPGIAKELLPHQSRVVAERIELADKVNNLEAFILSPAFSKAGDERILLSAQLEAMALYLAVLDIRVAQYTGAKRYVCNKEVLARPMTRLAYNLLRGWQLPANENGDDEGFLIEELDGAPANHPDFAGYLSWTPKPMFERSYKAIP